MALDHYISQAHLRKFYSPSLGERMYAIRKTNLKAFTPNSESVCRIADGSTNAYLRDERAVEEFLKTIEPNYNSALEKLIVQKVDAECIYTIAGFVAYVITGSPAAVRIQSEPLKDCIETATAVLDNQGVFGLPPPELAGPSLTELLHRGVVRTAIDPKYSQAIGIHKILDFTALLGNFTWEILRNCFDDSPFFTSDFPAAFESTNDPRELNRIVPLSPNLAVRIIPDPTFDKRTADFAFGNFRCRTRNVVRQELLELNRLIVRCAEDIVFYRDDHPWVRSFIAKNRHYHIEPHTQKVKTPTGTLLFSTHKVAVNPRLAGSAQTFTE